MLYDGNAETEEEREAISITGGWEDVTNHAKTEASSSSGSNSLVTKNTNSITLYSNGWNKVAAVACKNDFGNLHFYKLYTKILTEPTLYNGNSSCAYMIKKNPIEEDFYYYRFSGNNLGDRLQRRCR